MSVRVAIAFVALIAYHLKKMSVRDAYCFWKDLTLGGVLGHGTDKNQVETGNWGVTSFGLLTGFKIVDNLGLKLAKNFRTAESFGLEQTRTSN